MSLAESRFERNCDTPVTTLPSRQMQNAAWSCSAATCASARCRAACARRVSAPAAITAGGGWRCSCWRCSTSAPAGWSISAISPAIRSSRFCGLARIPTAHSVANWLRQFTQATLAPLVQLNHDLVTDAIAKLLSAPGPDEPHPAMQEPAGQRPRFRAGRGLPPGRARRPPRPLRPAAAAGVPHGRRVLSARRAACASGPRLWLRHQGRLLELAAPQATTRPCKAFCVQESR